MFLPLPCIYTRVCTCSCSCRIGLSAVTTGIMNLASAKAVMGAEHMAEASKLVKGQAPLRFHVPDRTKRSLCFEGDVRRLPRRADVWTALPPPLLALHAQLPLELSADELDVLPLLGVDPAELRRVRAAGGPKEAAVNAALRGLQESLRASIADAYRRSCLAPRTAVPALTRLSGSEGRLLLLLPVTLSSVIASGARVVVGLAISERSGGGSGGGAGGAGADAEFSDAATFPGTAPGPGGSALAEASSSSARAMPHLAYTVGAILSMPQARSAARLLQPIAGTWLQPVAGSPDAAHWPPPSSVPLPSAITVAAPAPSLHDGDAADAPAPAPVSVSRAASAASAAGAPAAGKGGAASAKAADAASGLTAEQVAFAAAVNASTAAGGAGAASRPTAAAVAGRAASGPAAAAASSAASSAAAAAAAAAAAPVPADEADSMFRKAVVATVVRKAAPAAAGKPGSAAAAAGAAPAAATIKLEVRDAEAVEMLLIMTPPELQTHPHFVALRNNGVLQLGWDKATFYTPTGEVVVHASDKMALLEAAASQGHDVIATLVSAENPFRLLVKAVRFH